MIVTTIKVTTAGASVVSPKAGTVKSVLARARTANTGTVYVGTSDVSSTIGLALEPGEAERIVFNGLGKLKDFYADADTNNDQVDLFADNT